MIYSPSHCHQRRCRQGKVMSMTAKGEAGRMGLVLSSCIYGFSNIIFQCILFDAESNIDMVIHEIYCQKTIYLFNIFDM